MTLAHSYLDVASLAPSPGMAFWRPDLATGIPAIDEQHRDLLAWIAELEAAAHAGDVDHAEDMLGYLERYAAEHFATEERVMWELGYPELNEHWSLHLAFAMELAQRKDEHETNPSRAALLVDLGRWMDRWLNEHVLQADAQMARFVRARAGAPGARPAAH